MSEVNYDNIDQSEMRVISRITNRAIEFNPKLDRMTINMDLTAVHCNCGGLRLDDMFKTDKFNLMHDVYGIAENLNRQTIELENCFSPRFSA